MILLNTAFVSVEGIKVFLNTAELQWSLECGSNKLVFLFPLKPAKIGLLCAMFFTRVALSKCFWQWNESFCEGLVTFKRMYPPFYRSVFHNGSIVVFFSITTVSAPFLAWNVTSVTYNLTLKYKLQTSLPTGNGNGVYMCFLAGEPAFNKPML